VFTNPTLDKLVALNLGGMARALAEQQEQPGTYGPLSFEDRIGLLVDREATERENRRLERYRRAAKLRIAAAVEDVDFRAARGLDRGVFLDLAGSRWVVAHQQVLITGPTGIGKTYLACALAEAAIRAGHSALYLRTPRALTEIAVARLDGRLPRLLAAWARIDVLVLDDFALQPLADAAAADLLEVVEDRAGIRSTIVTSQLPVALWHESLGEPTVADAICDRLLAAAHRIELSGVSLRRSEPRTAPDAPPSDAPASPA
jgi:DNA replication protein DnaC